MRTRDGWKCSEVSTPAREIKKGIEAICCVYWERRLFDSLIPLPDGTSHNAYLVRGEHATALIVGTPTVHVGPHPAVYYAQHLANLLKPKVKYAAIIGSYGWSSKAIEQIAAPIPNLKVEVLGTVLHKGLPDDDTLAQLDALAATVAKNMQRCEVVTAPCRNG